MFTHLAVHLHVDKMYQEYVGMPLVLIFGESDRASKECMRLRSISRNVKKGIYLPRVVQKKRHLYA